jgi:hypothetical protein
MAEPTSGTDGTSTPSNAERLAKSAEVLGYFEVLPGRFENRRVLVRFTTGPHYQRVSAEECEALKLPHGKLLRAVVPFEPRPAPPAMEAEDPFRELRAGATGLYVFDAVAEQLLRLPAGRTVLAEAVTRFGTRYEWEGEGDDAIRVPRCHQGVVVVKLVEGADAELGAAPDPAA